MKARIRRNILLLGVLAWIALSTLSYASDWRDAKGDHFIIYYESGHEQFAQEVLSYAEGYYDEIARDLGYQRYSEFWLWDKRVKIYIHKDHKAYLAASKMPEWSHGMADYENKQIMSYLRGDGFLDSILPHEIAHLLFRDFVGFTGEIPLWLDEGVAQWEEKKRRPYYKQVMRQAFADRKILSIPDMMSLNIRRIKTDDELYIRYTSHKGDPVILLVTGDHLINLYYLESVSLVGFLIEKYGTKKFTVFCRELRDGKTVAEALKQAYPYSMKDLNDLDMKWREYVEGAE